MGEGESVFCKSVAPGKLSTFQWKAIHTKLYGQHRLNLMGSGEVDTKFSGLGRENGGRRSWRRV